MLPQVAQGIGYIYLQGAPSHAPSRRPPARYTQVRKSTHTGAESVGVRIASSLGTPLKELQPVRNPKFCKIPCTWVLYFQCSGIPVRLAAAALIIIQDEKQLVVGVRTTTLCSQVAGLVLTQAGACFPLATA